jgi:hypothetical protein
MDGHIRIWRRVGKDNYNTWEFLTELQGPDEVMVRRRCFFESISTANKLFLFAVFEMASQGICFASRLK